MKTATATASSEFRENGAPEMTLREYFAQNPDVVVFKEKVERAKENLRRAGLTTEVLKGLLEKARNNQLPKPKELTAEELKIQTEDYVFELFLGWEKSEETVAQLRRELEEKDRLIAALHQQLESRVPVAA